MEREAPFILLCVLCFVAAFNFFMFLSVPVCLCYRSLRLSNGYVVSWCLFSDPKPIENPSPNLQNSPQKPSKSRSRRDCVLGRIFVLTMVRFEASLGPSWERLGASRGVLGASWERLGGSWARLGGMFGRLGRVLERPGRVLGASWRVLRASSLFGSIFQCLFIDFSLKNVFQKS